MLKIKAHVSAGDGHFYCSSDVACPKLNCHTTPQPDVFIIIHSEENDITLIRRNTVLNFTSNAVTLSFNNVFYIPSIYD